MKSTFVVEIPAYNELLEIHDTIKREDSSFILILFLKINTEKIITKLKQKIIGQNIFDTSALFFCSRS